VLGVSLAGTSAGYIVFAIGIITKNIPLLFLARGFDGVTGGNIPVAQAVVADITPPKDRAKNFGLIGAAFGLGFIIGPYIGGKLSDPSVVSWFNAATPFWFAALLSAANIVLVITLLPETLARAQKELKIRWDRSLIDVAHAYTYKGFRTLFTTAFLFQGGFTFYTTFIGVYFINKFSFTSGNIGDFLAYVGLWIVRSIDARRDIRHQCERRSISAINSANNSGLSCCTDRRTSTDIRGITFHRALRVNILAILQANVLA
jgi:DHA1 family tetracycline resistance protein-like MFS transporter